MSSTWTEKAMHFDSSTNDFFREFVFRCHFAQPEWIRIYSKRELHRNYYEKREGEVKANYLQTLVLGDLCGSKLVFSSRIFPAHPTRVKHVVPCL